MNVWGDNPILKAGDHKGYRDCSLIRLGRVDYDYAWQLQRQLVEARYSGVIDDALLLLEHPHTYTTGRAGKDQNILFTDALLTSINAKFYRVDRGGDITYHGPGQLVGYPIIDLRQWSQDLHRYMRSLEEVIIQTIGDFGIAAGRVPGATGVWIGDEKVGAIGVRVSRWITFHGFALNIDPDLGYFGNIIPCGLVDKGVTSLANVLKTKVDPDLVVRHLVAHFAEQFKFEIVPTGLPQVEEAMRQAQLSEQAET